MDTDQTRQILAVLEQIRDNQAAMLELVRRQNERTERIQDRAEELQSRSSGMIRVARGTLAVVLPIVILLIAYLSWLLFR